VCPQITTLPMVCASTYLATSAGLIFYSPRASFTTVQTVAMTHVPVAPLIELIEV